MKYPVPFCLVFTFENIANGSSATVTKKNSRLEPLRIMGLTFASYSDASNTRGTNWPTQIRTSGSADYWFSSAIVPSLFGGSSDSYDSATEASATTAYPWFFPEIGLAYGQEVTITAQNATGTQSNCQFMLWGYYGDPLPAIKSPMLPGILVAPPVSLLTGVASDQVTFNNRALPFLARDLVIARPTTVDNFNLKAQILLSGAGVQVFSEPVHTSCLNGPMESFGSLAAAGSAAGRMPFRFPGGGLLIPPSAQVQLQLTNLATNSSSAQGAFRGEYVRG